MRTLHHVPHHPPSRLVRLALAEKRLPVELRSVPIWERPEDFLILNPAGEVPVLRDREPLANEAHLAGAPGAQPPKLLTLCGASVIVEYLEEAYPQINLMGRTLAQKAETRRLVDWFMRLFDRDVTSALVGEKIDKRLSRQSVDSTAIRRGYKNLKFHLDYLGWLAETRSWLGGHDLSLADFAAAAQISTLDYLGEINWHQVPAVRDWYSRIKSRPCFRGLLSDRVPGRQPPAHYADLDF
ncbi:glutathione S-transferase family protein [Formicincola oecophyllae]|uniref:Glutathione S-transferase family protein n=1 Tax=Formicincola oecophyllae TaxID=2558361 RepID=A0A4Y6U749_9PROT|nr:glutathione S-transferase family protein [Formicincola oecophyllae]QDH13213.1 glutathione S-transferase family protein [Formicincola oecophyllae]